MKVCYCHSDLIKRSRYEIQEMKRRGFIGGTYIAGRVSDLAEPWDGYMPCMYVCPRCDKIEWYMEKTDFE